MRLPHRYRSVDLVVCVVRGQFSVLTFYVTKISLFYVIINDTFNVRVSNDDKNEEE